ncbi:MAG: proprotein convertase P-domain-containing protein [Saprospiraceae bacterium]|nr:proprotein convertase P-domain-containing protein [Saprospiraceae bacterium]
MIYINNLLFIKKPLLALFLGLLVHHAYSQRTESYHPDSDQSSEYRTILIQLDPNSEPVKKTVQIIDGYVIIEGDIILGTKAELFGPRAAVVTNFGNNRWPNSVVPYEIESGYPDINMIYYAINHIINNTNLCMVPRTNETDYVRFVNSSGCSSFIGKIGGAQNINVSINCGISSTVHEILHAAGFYHEQSRDDRNTFVTINTANITSGNASNFDQYSFGSDIGVYDYGSIMHYGPYAFSSNGLPTIEIKIPPGTSSTNIGQRVGLSDDDVAAVNTIYPANPGCSPVTVPANLTIRSLGNISISGSVVSITDCMIENDGSSTIASTVANFFYAPQGNNSVTFFGGSKSIPSLAAGQSHAISVTNDFAALADGTHYFGVWVNSAQNPVEVHDNDNYASWNAPLLTLPAIPCDAPSITSVTTTQPPDCNDQTGSISISASGDGTLEYSVDNGANWQSSNFFNGLFPGAYQVVVRLESTPSCFTQYDQNPVTLDLPTGCNNCLTFTASDLPQNIVDNMSITSTINIPLSGTITDVNVLNLNGTHTWINDLTFTLVSPSGTQVTLIDNQCGNADNFNINLDDQALNTIICPFNNGNTEKPVNALSAFGGENPLGNWQLIINDNVTQDAGTFSEWTLELCGNFNTGNCDPVLAIDDNPILPDTYHAGILLTSEGLVGSGNSVTFKAGQSIELQPNFSVEANAILQLMIEGCN